MKVVKYFVFALLIASGSTAVLHAQSAAKLTGRSGMVEVLRSNQWMQLTAGDLINSGEKVRTGVDSTATVEFGSGQVLTLNANSEIQITDLNKRVYVADGRRFLPHGIAVCPNFSLYPYVQPFVEYPVK